MLTQGLPFCGVPHEGTYLSHREPTGDTVTCPHTLQTSVWNVLDEMHRFLCHDEQCWVSAGLQEVCAKCQSIETYEGSDSLALFPTKQLLAPPPPSLPRAAHFLAACPQTQTKPAGYIQTPGVSTSDCSSINEHEA